MSREVWGARGAHVLRAHRSQPRAPPSGSSGSPPVSMETQMNKPGTEPRPGDMCLLQIGSPWPSGRRPDSSVCPCPCPLQPLLPPDPVLEPQPKASAQAKRPSEPGSARPLPGRGIGASLVPPAALRWPDQPITLQLVSPWPGFTWGCPQPIRARHNEQGCKPWRRRPPPPPLQGLEGQGGEWGGGRSHLGCGQ